MTSPHAPRPADELTFLAGMPSAPAPTSSLYVVKRQQTLAKGVRRTVSGVHLEINEGSDLQAFLSATRTRVSSPETVILTVREVDIFCDTLDLNCRLDLPQCDIRIFARSLNFGPKGVIDTSALEYVSKRASEALHEPPTEAKDGYPGQNAGNVTLYVKTADLRVAQAPCILARGGKGQGAGLGKDGRFDGHSMPAFEGNKPIFHDRERMMRRRGSNGPLPGLDHKDWYVTVRFDTPARFYEMEFSRNALTSNDFVREGDPNTLPGHGDPALKPGRPGAGGRGGTIRSSVPAFEGHVQNPGGAAGALADPVKGGRGGTPRKSCKYTGFAETFFYNETCFLHRWVPYDFFETQDGESFDPPGKDTTPGATPPFEHDADPRRWLHPMQVQRVLAFARDAYLGGDREGVKTLLTEYAEDLRALKETAPGWDDRPALPLAAARAEIAAMLGHIAAQLDYYGNPAGFMPLLSLPSAMRLYEIEVKNTVRTLLLSRWLTAEANAHRTAAAGMTAMILQTNDSTAFIAGNVEKAEESIRILSGSLDALVSKIADLTGRIKTLEKRLEADATATASTRARIKGIIKIAGAITQLIPVGQPYLGSVGKLADVITDFDSGKYEESAKKISAVVAKAKDAIVDHRKVRAETLDTLKKEQETLIKEQEAQKKEKEKLDQEVKAFEPDVDGKQRERGKAVVKPPAEKPAEPTPEQKAAKKKRNEQWKQVGDNLGDAVTQVASGIRLLQVPKSEIDGELTKLKLESKEWKELAADLEQLMERKAAIFKNLAETLPAVTEGYARIATNTAAVARLQEQKGAALEALEPESVLFIEDMAQRARLTLQHVLYLTVRALESTLFREVRVDWSLNEILQKIADTLETSKDWSPAAFSQNVDTLETMFSDIRRKVREELRESLQNGLPGALPLEVGISRTQNAALLEELEATGRIRLDPLALGLVPPTMERVRLISVDLGAQTAENKRLPGLRFDQKGPPLPESGNLEITLRVGKTGAVRSGSKLFGVHHDAPREWRWIYGFSGAAEQKAAPTAATLDQLNLLLEDTKVEIKEKLAMPVAWSDLELEVNYPTSLPPERRPRIERLLLSFKVDGAPAADGVFVLDVRTDNPYVTLTVDKEDLNGRTNGRGRLYRLYPNGTTVRLGFSGDSPIPFAGWRATAGRHLAMSQGADPQSIVIDMTQHVVAECNFRAPPPAEPARTRPRVRDPREDTVMESAWAVRNRMPTSFASFGAAAPEIAETETAETENALPLVLAAAPVEAVHAGPGEEFPVVAALSPDYELLEETASGGWCKVLSGMSIGYVRV